MTKKFNPKQYRGDRVYTPAPNSPRVSKLWIWDSEKDCYEPPLTGGVFYARRYDANRKREYRLFSTIDEARHWQSSRSTLGEEAEIAKPQSPTSGPNFGKIVAEWRKRLFPSISESTQVAYDKIIKLYLGSLLGLGILEITSRRVDLWLDELKDPQSKTMQSKRRQSFRHELSVLSTVFRYYEDYYDDDLDFQYPIRKRHKDSVHLNRPYTPRHKDLKEDQFLKFREELKNGPYGILIAALATLQFYQALRISEAAGLFLEDAGFDFKFPHRSRITIVRAICWPRKKGVPSFIKGGFKNSIANDGVKEQPMFPETYEALIPFYQDGGRGLIFQVDGKHLEYRTIQHAYDTAFKRAGLPFSGTHVLRHGGCRKLLNETGDMTIAKQHLGNTDMATVQVYAQREASALTKVAQGKWEQKLAETGCKWLHPKVSEKVS